MLLFFCASTSGPKARPYCGLAAVTFLEVDCLVFAGSLGLSSGDG